MDVLGRTCPDCRGKGKLTGDGGGMDGGGNYHHPPCETCDDEGQVVPAHAYRGAVPVIDEEALVRATRAVKAGRMGRATNRAVALAVLKALNIPHEGQ